MSWTDVEDAIHAWVVSGSGLTADHVMWSTQGIDLPRDQFIALRLSSIAGRGQSWSRVEPNPASTGSDGEEIIHKVEASQVVVLSLQCFGGVIAGALAVLQDVIMAPRLPSVAKLLRAGNVGVGPIGPVRAIDGFIGGGKAFEPRATVDVTLHITAELEEFGTYIQHVHVTNEITGDVLDVDLPAVTP